MCLSLSALYHTSNASQRILHFFVRLNPSNSDYGLPWNVADCLDLACLVLFMFHASFDFTCGLQDAE